MVSLPATARAELASVTLANRRNDSSKAPAADCLPSRAKAIMKCVSVKTSKADICCAKRHVRFAPKSRPLHCTSACPLWAKRRHSASIRSPRQSGRAARAAVKPGDKVLFTAERDDGVMTIKEITKDD